MESSVFKSYLYTQINNNIIHSRQNKPKCSSTGEWINKMCIHTHWNITKPLKKKIPIHSATLVKFENSTSSEIKVYKKEQILYDYTYMRHL